MLGPIRKFSNTIFAKIFLFIVAIPFVFWGMGNLFSSGNVNTIAEIEGEKISTNEFIEYIRIYSGPDQKVDSNTIDKLLTSFIGDKLISKEAESLSIKLSDASLSKIIKNQKIFKKDNKFSRVEYEKFLIKNSLNAVSFEANLEKQEKKKQLLDFIGEGVVPSNFLVNIGFNKINQKRNINLINLNKVFNKEIKLSDKDVKSYFDENKEKYKDLYKSIKFIELNSKNLTNNDQFTDLFFKKIDEIDDLIVEGNNLDFILQKYNLESFTTISLNEAGENKNSEKSINFSSRLLKDIFAIKDEEPTILINNEDKYYLVELISNEIIYKNINNPSVKQNIIDNLESGIKRKLISAYFDKINKNNFSEIDFNNVSKEKGVPIQKIKLENLNDNKILKQELVNQIYSIPEKKVFIIADLGLKESYLVFVNKIENISINPNSEDYGKYLKLAEARIKNSLFNGYDSYLGKKYKIDINYSALNNIKNNIE